MNKSLLAFCLCLGLSHCAWAFTVTGTVTYEKRVYSLGNPSGVVQNTPLSNTTVVANNGVSAITDANGVFSISLADNGTYSLFARSINDQFAVGTSLGSYYSVALASELNNAQNITTNVTEAQNSGAFNILVQLQRGVDWVNSKGQSFSSSRVSVKWPDTASYFEPEGRYMGFLGTESDHDEFDDDVILHEFGHLAMDVLSQDHSAGGAHSITNNELDLRLAWSEGVATWVSCAIQGDDRYLDANSSGLGINYTISGAFNNNSARTSACEWAVSYLVWNASQNVGNDADVMKVLAAFKNISEQISLDSFYKQWNSLIGTDLSTYVDQMSMSYKLDNDEPSNSSSPKLLGSIGVSTTTKSSLTFFETNDEDIYYFNPLAGSVYTISTNNTRNGALTKLEIYKGAVLSGNLIGTNIQANGLQSDSTSSIGVQASDSTPIMIKVSRFTSNSANYGYGTDSNYYSKTVGEFGSYDLQAFRGGAVGSVPSPSPTSSSGGGGGGCLLR